MNYRLIDGPARPAWYRQVDWPCVVAVVITLASVGIAAGIAIWLAMAG